MDVEDERTNSIEQLTLVGCNEWRRVSDKWICYDSVVKLIIITSIVFAVLSSQKFICAFALFPQSSTYVQNHGKN